MAQAASADGRPATDSVWLSRLADLLSKCEKLFKRVELETPLGSAYPLLRCRGYTFVRINKNNFAVKDRT